MLDLFSEEKVNVGRQNDLDIAKGLSIIFMIIVHCAMIAMFFKSSESVFFIHAFCDILGGPTAAPIFMFCMGIGIVYSRRSSPELMIKRGICLLILGLLVNIGECILPHFVAGYLFNEFALFDIHGGLILFYVDILAFAGLSFILMGLFRKLKLSNKQIFLIAILMSLIGSFVRYVDFNNEVLNLIFGYFIGTTDVFTAFPLFNWFIFPASGYIYGHYFIRCKDKSKFFRFWPILIIIALAYFIITIYLPGGYLQAEETYYFLNTTDAAFTLIYAHAYIGLCYWLSKFLPSIFIKFFTIMSKYINGIYIAQWIFIPLTFIFISYFNQNLVFNDLSIIIISAFILIISILIAVINRKIALKYDINLIK